MTKKNIDQIKLISERKKPFEACGFILKKNKKYLTVECENVSDNQETNFEISNKEYLFAFKNYEIISIFHSHVLGDETFSKEDLGISDELDIPMIVYSLKTNNINFYNPSKKRHNKINSFFQKEKAVVV
jgi:proteasome lid subunit RPN8/RPN11